MPGIQRFGGGEAAVEQAAHGEASFATNRAASRETLNARVQHTRTKMTDPSRKAQLYPLGEWTSRTKGEIHKLRPPKLNCHDIHDLLLIYIFKF